MRVQEHAHGVSIVSLNPDDHITGWGMMVLSGADALAVHEPGGEVDAPRALPYSQ
jgi:hypothetical protein